MSAYGGQDRWNGQLARTLLALLGAGVSIACATALIQSFAAALARSFP